MQPLRRRRQRRRVGDLGDRLRVRFCLSAGEASLSSLLPRWVATHSPSGSASSACSVSSFRRGIAYLVQEAEQLLGVLVVIGVVQRSGSAQARDWASAVNGDWSQVATHNRCDGRQGAMRHAPMRECDTQHGRVEGVVRTVTRDEILLVRRKEVTSTPRVTLLPASSQLWSPASARPRPATQHSPLPDGELERQEVAGRNELLCSVSLFRHVQLTRSDPSMLLELGFTEDLE